MDLFLNCFAVLLKQTNKGERSWARVGLLHHREQGVFKISQVT